MKIPRTSGRKYRRANDGIPTWNELREMRAKRMGEEAALKIQEQSNMIMNQDSNNGTPAAPSAPVSPFNFNGAEVRAITKDGLPWFIAVEVCAILDLANPRSSLALLDLDEKDVHTMDTLGGGQEMAVINESGLYSLILRSRKPEAKAFKKWITSEVLPALRKTGSYAIGFAIPKTLPDALRAYALEVEKSERLALQVATMAPKAEFFDAVTASQDTLDMNRACKTLGVGRNKMFRELRGHKVFTDQNLPMQQFIDCGYFAVSESKWEHPVTGETHITLSTRVFQKGLEFLRRKAGEYGLIELN